MNVINAYCSFVLNYKEEVPSCQTESLFCQPKLSVLYIRFEKSLYIYMKKQFLALPVHLVLYIKWFLRRYLYPLHDLFTLTRN
ncbi:hypothetical protein PGIGA_G00118670 [Pangasianodon gigas]|uniref:Uncharacterized protein n=1 Tax=Pangasianodon gigas TaxID=30993 RepID=A0ACC5XH24_PANGG|nr:hypothetical protein [Pangasianodon gigas]